MRRAVLTALLLVPLATLHSADVVLEEDPVSVNSFAVASYQLGKGEAVAWEVSPEPVKSKEYVDGSTAYLHFNGPPGTKYKVTAFIIDFESRKFTKKHKFVTIGGKADLPPSGALYFLVVRADGPATASHTKLMSLPEWETLKAKGHTFKDKTFTEAVMLGAKFPIGTHLPCVVILRTTLERSEQIAVVPAPTDGAGILQLPGRAK